MVLFFSLFVFNFYIYQYAGAIQKEFDIVDKPNKNSNSVSLENHAIHDPCLSVELQDKSLATIHVIDDIKNSSIFTSIDMKIVQSSHFVDAADFLKDIPGFSMIRNGGTNNDLVFRGMNNSRMRVLIENSEIIGACCARMDPPTSYINLKTFDILNIIKGPQTVLFGPTVSGGILQFKRYRASYFDIPKIELNSDVTVGSYNSTNRNVDSTLGNKYGYIRLIGTLAKSDDYYDGRNNKVHSAWDKWNSDVILALTFKELDTDIEMNIGKGNGIVNYATKMMDGLCFDRENYGLKIETIDINYLLSKIELQMWYNHIHHLMDKNKFHIDETQQHSCNAVSNKQSCCSHDNIINDFDRFLWGIRSIATCDWENMQCYSGIDSQINYHRKNCKYNNYYPIDIFVKDIGIFSECSYNLFCNQKLIGGTRIEYTINNIYTNNKSDRLNKSHVIYPTGFIRYENSINSLLSYYIGIGCSQRFPDYWELIFSPVSAENINKIVQLKPEKTVQIDVGMDFKQSNTDIQVSSYAGYIKDYIFYYNKNKYTQNNVNNVNAKILGSEIVCNYKFNDYWYGKSNIAWSWGINIDDRCMLPTIFPTEGTLILQFRKKNYFLESSCKFVLPSKYIQNIFSVPFIFCKTDYASYTNNSTTGFSVFSIYFVWKPFRYTTYIMGIDNILNKNYIEYSNICNRSYESVIAQKDFVYAPGRTWWFTVQTNL